MKFIHCSDLHLDSRIESLSSEKTSLRREEILHTFERLVNYARENGVSAVIIAGDMFDTSRVTLKTKGRVIQAIESVPNIDFLYLCGNHDEDNFISGLEVLPKNLKVFSDIWCTYSYDDVDISGIVFTNSNKHSVYDNLNLNPEKINIVTMHGQIAGYKNDEEVEIISIPLLKEKHIDYLALGHLHSYTSGVIDNRGIYSYSGCLDGRGFDETGKKGFVLISVDNDKLTKEFVPFSSRELYEVVFDVSSKDTFLKAREELLNLLKNNYDKTSLIKVVLKGEHKPDFDIDKKGLEFILNEYFFFAKVYDKTELEVCIDDYLDDKSVRGEFIRSVWQSDMPQQEKQRVIMCGINALSGEDF